MDIRDGALDYLFNVYRRILPGLGGYLTDHGGKVNLDRVDVILAEVGSIEDYVFEMKHANEQREKARREQYKQNGTGDGKMPAGGIVNAPKESFQKIGRSARIMAENGSAASKQGTNSEGDVKLQRGYMAKEELRKKLKGKPSSEEENAKAAEALKQQLLGAVAANPQEEDEVKEEAEPTGEGGALKRKASDMASAEGDDDDEMFGDSESFVGDPDIDETEEETEEDRALMDEAHKNLKEKVKAVESAKLDDYAKNVKDNVRLHEPGWKVR